MLAWSRGAVRCCQLSTREGASGAESSLARIAKSRDNVAEYALWEHTVSSGRIASTYMTMATCAVGFVMVYECGQLPTNQGYFALVGPI